MNLRKLNQVLPESVYDDLLEVAPQFKLNTPLRLAHALAQWAHESQGFTRVRENMNYSSERLIEVFPTYFNDALAAKYERHPVAIASYVYANRHGNGPESSQDGWKYRAHGYGGLTFKNNFRLFDLTVEENILLNPDLVATKYALLSAAWFWNMKDLNSLADENNLKAITKVINGGYNGLKDREKWFNVFSEALK